MPKGQPPSERMQARRDAYGAEFLRLTRKDNPPNPTNSIGEPRINNDVTNRLNMMMNDIAEAIQVRKNAGALAELSAKADKIDTNRENEAQRSTRARIKMR